MTVGAPLPAIRFLVERTSRTGLVVGPDEGISVDAALFAHTAGAAGIEIRGTLAPGDVGHGALQ